RNILVVAGTAPERIRENVPTFLAALWPSDPGTWVIPRLFDPVAPPSRREQRELDSRRENWSDLPDNYMAYYASWAGERYARTGKDAYAELYRDAMVRLAERKEYVHLYLYREVKHWDLIEESPVLTDGDRLAITNFFRECADSDKEGFGYLRRYLRRPRLLHGNHQTQAACGLLAVADYLRRYYPDDLHEAWFQEAKGFFDTYRDRGSFVSDETGLMLASVSNVMESIYRTLDDPSEHPFLRDTLKRLMAWINNYGMVPAFGDTPSGWRSPRDYYLLGARIYGDPEFLWMYHHLRSASPKRRAGIRPVDDGDWWPVDIEPRVPEGLDGVQWSEPDEILYSVADTRWAARNQVTAEDCYGKVAFRGGLGPQDDYLLLDGIGLKGHAYEDANGILEYSALGRTFLVSLDSNYGAAPSAHNGVCVSVDGMASAPPMLAARRLWADFAETGATRTVLHNDGSADWERNVIWLRNTCTVVFDRVIAKRTGMHSATAFWRAVGEAEASPDGIRVTQGASGEEVTFRMDLHAADDVVLGREEDPQAGYNFHRYTRPAPPLDDVPHVIHVLKGYKARELEKGNSFSLASVFWASSKQRPIRIGSRSIADAAVLLDIDGHPALAAMGPLAVDGLQVDAELSMVSPDRILGVGARGLTIETEEIFGSDLPVSFEWDLRTGAVALDAAEASQVRLVGTSMAVEAGRATRKIGGRRLSDRVREALRAIPSGEGSKKARRDSETGTPLKIARRRLADGAVLCGWVGPLAPDAAPTLLLGREGGAVEALDPATLETLWTYTCAGPVNSIAAGDLDGDGVLEPVLGSDDHHVHALDAEGSVLWKWKPPFDELKASIMYNHWLWPEPFVKKVATHDLDGDGADEIVLSGGMNTFAVDGRGEMLWAYQEEASTHGSRPSLHELVFADANNDGRDEVIGGASDMWYHGAMIAIGADGKKLKQYRSDGWVSGVTTALCEDFAGKGRPSLAYGTRMGGVFFYPDPADRRSRWYRRFADRVDVLNVLDREEGGKILTVAGGDTGWVTALDREGDRVWAVYAGARVRAMASGDRRDRLTVACEGGLVLELDAQGAVVRSASLHGSPSVVLGLPDGEGAIVATREGGVFRLE
ncbi:MAG: hypothetical protein QGI83_24955, partial [Candidatus Latescibacteria bacterium]|nr:hypothetical protein [Candidatus Latescibacterota bacterium]